MTTPAVNLSALLVVIAFLIAPNFSARADTGLTIDGSQQFQTIDGLGANANSLSWKNGELIPAIDKLADDMGATLWRVVFDMEDWETVNDNSDPAVLNWDYYNSIYASEKFQNLWGTIGYLNRKGISSGIILSLMGRVPVWMGGGDGSRIDVAVEDEWVEMVASLAYYARNTMHLSFAMLDPLNEPDWKGIEGPQVDRVQYTRLLEKLARRLDAIGLGDIRFVGPNTADVVNGVNNYMADMMSDSVVMSKVDHFGFHNYAGYTGSADQAIKNSPYPGKNFYMTEITRPDDILKVLDDGAGGICIWEGYDSVYDHAVLMGYGSTPPNDAGNGPAPLAYSTTTGSYSERKAFYLYKQLYKFVPQGSVRIAATHNSENIVLAFYHPSSGVVTIVGYNIGTSALTYSANLANLPALSMFLLYWTSETDPSVNFSRGDDVAVTGKTFTYSAPPSSMFTLTGLADWAAGIPPAVSITAPANNTTVSGLVPLLADTFDNAAVTGVEFYVNGILLSTSTVTPYTYTWNTKVFTNGTYDLVAKARDKGGNTGQSARITVIVSNDFTLPMVMLSDNGNLSEHRTISAAYSAIDGDHSRISVQSGILEESISFNKNISVSVAGGLDPDYTTVTGISTVIGNMSVINGSVELTGGLAIGNFPPY